MTHRDDTLFWEGDLRPTLENVEAKAAQEVAELPADYLLKVSEQDLVDTLAAKYALEPLELLRDKVVLDGPREVDIDISHDFRFARVPGERAVVRGTAVSIVVPFRGDPGLFKLKPSTWNTNIPHGKIVGQELHLVFRGVDMNAEQLKRESDSALGNIEQYIGWQRDGVRAFNDRLPNTLQQAVAARKAKLLRDMNLVAGLGIPVRRRDLPDTFAVPAVRRKPKIELPAVTAGPFQPEPVLADEHYSFVLKVVQDMALVMERSPSAFTRMEEEHLRDHFLVPLNGHFEGSATGETFNFEGKTDILIRHAGRNVFIAECKFWRGDKAFSETIDQLLGYTSWRDTKTAIVLFNRNRSFTNVLQKIPGLVKSHPNYKRDLGTVGETQFRFVLHHREDRNRELVLTVLAFDVPTAAEAQLPEGASQA